MIIFDNNLIIFDNNVIIFDVICRNRKKEKTYEID